MHWESLHELLAFRLLDADPRVISFTEQPLTVIYVLDGVMRKHYPDIMVATINSKELWEVKTEEEANEPETVQRTALMEAGLPNFGFDYRVVTPTSLSSEVEHANALVILRRGRASVSALARERIRRVAQIVNPITWGDIHAGLLGENGVAEMSRLILEGAFSFDRSLPLRDGTVISGTGFSTYKWE